MADAKSELYELGRLNAQPVKNSGRGKFQKGDGVILSPSGDSIFTVDIKESIKSFGLSLASWAKVSTDAKKNQTVPLLKVVLGSEEPKERVVVISESMFLEMYESWCKENYE